MKKKEQESKLNFNKFQIAKIKNLHKIIGGENVNKNTVDTKIVSI